MTDVSADVAESILAAAEEKATEIEVPMCIAVFDDALIWLHFVGWMMLS
ncbi:hypothetical protein [Haladaptatus sp. R4]